MIIGRDVRGQVSPTRLQARIGGLFDGNDMELSVRENRVLGRCGGGVIGFDIDLSFSDDGRVDGRLGGDFVGHSIDAVVHDVEPVMAAALFTITYYMYQVNHRSNSGGSSGGGN
jgi:hypothetical protein